MGPKEDLVGQQFGYWTVLLFAGKNKHGQFIWLCRCKCGTERVVWGFGLKHGLSKSCYCYSRDRRVKSGSSKKLRLPPGEPAFRQLLSTYRRASSQRGLPFTLTEQEFRNITQSLCFYCETPPAQKRDRRMQIPYIYNGIDRRDSSIGYTTENCVPCCKSCNYMKNTMSVTNFLQQVDKIYQVQHCRSSLSD